MKMENQGRLEQFETALDAAFAAAMERVCDRAGEVISAARLASAVHMASSAESEAGPEVEKDNVISVSGNEAAIDGKSVAALLVRQGEPV